MSKKNKNLINHAAIPHKDSGYEKLPLCDNGYHQAGCSYVI